MIFRVGGGGGGTWIGGYSFSLPSPLYKTLFIQRPHPLGFAILVSHCLLVIQKSLSFPDDVEVSEALRELIKKLLMDKESRLQFRGIKTHPFFSNTNWDNLTTGGLVCCLATCVCVCVCVCVKQF